MAHAVPLFDRSVVNAAGRTLVVGPSVHSAEMIRALEVINNWRASHSYPLNLLHMTLRNRSAKVSGNALTAQRTKRLESIHAKLSRQENMHLSQMQDIGGCRCILPGIDAVRKLHAIYATREYSHSNTGFKNYIESPKSDGYRSIHLIYKYFPSGADKECYKDLKIEIQMRSALQHSWATAVEAVGTFTRQALKSNQGERDWLRFFSLVSSDFALLEKSAPVPGVPSDHSELVKEIRSLSVDLRVLPLLQSYNATLEHVGKQKDKKYFLVHLRPDSSRVELVGFRADESKMANDRYTKLEATIPANSRDQVVLVSVESVAALKRAYPNYFLDTTLFVKQVQRIMGVRTR
ncbi:(p)ppGpp synthetase [Variovorax sp. WS11]|uniref:RelA/SpoT domain-containing protein n=1 Tax=Variovorax sp. WS11 TaxID=1105204 RepID=UPI000D0E17DF|nr:RelA/SpoT domain-containing protein [Variovorax sp. WS11]NDZ12060.1 RelA/SpoT domain-containing protein [Variovorax sp. WS11]PSL83758.1 (p)ppGpp synthetase [Variovorax sp. WS11]